MSHETIRDLCQLKDAWDKKNNELATSKDRGDGFITQAGKAALKTAASMTAHAHEDGSMRIEFHSSCGGTTEHRRAPTCHLKHLNFVAHPTLHLTAGAQHAIPETWTHAAVRTPSGRMYSSLNLGPPVARAYFLPHPIGAQRPNPRNASHASQNQFRLSPVKRN